MTVRLTYPLNFIQICRSLRLILFYPLLSAIPTAAQDLLHHGPDNLYYAWDIVEGRNNRLFLCTSGGLYYSDDRAQHWQLVSSPFNDIFLEPYLVTDSRNNDLYVNFNSSFYRSSDNGVSWTSTNMILPPNILIREVAMSGDTIWMGTHDGRLFFARTTDQAPQSVALPETFSHPVSGIHVDGRTITIATGGKGLYRSLDGGNTWSEFNNGLPIGYRVWGFNLHPGRWLVYGLEGTFESSNNGASWVEVTNGLTTKQLNDVHFVGDEIYASSYSYDNVWRLPAGSDTWELIDEGIDGERGSMEFIWADDDLVIAGGWRGVYKRGVSAGPFTEAYAGVTNAAVIRDIDQASDGSIWVGSTHGGVFRKAPDESAFTEVHHDQGNYFSTRLRHDTVVMVRDYRIEFLDAITREPKGEFVYTNVPFAQDFALAWGDIFVSTQQNGIFRYNGTAEWQPFSEGLSSMQINDFVYNQGTLWAATQDGLFRRDQGDDTWERVPTGGADERMARVLYSNGGRMLAAVNGSSFVSDDAGATWNRLVELNTFFVEAFTVHDDRIYASNYNSIMISSTDRSTWTRYTFDEGPIPISAMRVLDGRMYIATWERGIWSMPVAHLLRKQQVITATVPPALTVGSEVVLVATSDSGLPVLFRVVSGPAQLEGNELTIEGEGTVVVEAYQAGDDVYRPGKQVFVIEAQVVMGLDDELIDALSIYPNPAEGWLYVSDGLNRPAMVTVTDMQGRELVRKVFRGDIKLDLSRLERGMYVVGVRWKDGKVVRRRVVRG